MVINLTFFFLFQDPRCLLCFNLTLSSMVSRSMFQFLNNDFVAIDRKIMEPEKDRKYLAIPSCKIYLTIEIPSNSA